MNTLDDEILFRQKDTQYKVTNTLDGEDSENIKKFLIGRTGLARTATKTESNTKSSRKFLINGQTGIVDIRNGRGDKALTTKRRRQNSKETDSEIELQG